MTEKESILLAIAVGDSFGRPFEFNTEAFIKKHNNTSYYHERTQKRLLNTTKGRYTDDTQMTIALTEFVLSGLVPSQANIMKYFMMAAQRDEVHGYTRGMTALLKMKQTKKALDAIASKPSRQSNGCVMRAIPIGFINDPALVKHYSMMQCITTHPEADCIFATQFLALWIHYHVHNVYSVSDSIGAWFNEQLGFGSYDRMWNYYNNNPGPIQVNAMQTVSFCLQAMYYYDTMKEILFKSVEVGGDVDSTASISMGMAVAFGKENDLPQRLYHNIQNDAFGKNYILQLERTLKNTNICRTLTREEYRVIAKIASTT